MNAVVNCLMLCLAYVEFNNQVNAAKTYFNCQVMIVLLLLLLLLLLARQT